ncbi:hypothetical protein BBD42_24870 [Paenibacillus sp. BIHB 4019]|uniref:DNA-binding response regulator n=1 Tax=Paenibacillus sp. BIHB 4019 TaxID=1870819 RepID=A0A1B2DNR8_9BACL|nr:helix-turn-helix domain-containing protein [Paenibacillus sp. BIHB 4019]ANY69353.1 hypothetical protein BBD42_24870 [Paenibacillus sp. BIHB 4019]
MFSLLIVDDEEILREGLKDAVPWEDWGFQVVALAGSGEEGLECFAHLRPDVLMTDIKMYELSGLDLLKAAKEMDPECEVVLLSGYEDFHYAKQGIALGAAAYMLKLNLFDEAEQIFLKLRGRLEARQELERNQRDALRKNAAVELGNRLRGEPSSAEELIGDYFVAALHTPAGIASLHAELSRAAADLEWRIAEIGKNILVACIPRSASELERDLPWPDAQRQFIQLMDVHTDVIAGIGAKVPGSAIEVSFRQAMKMVDYGLLHGSARRYAFDEMEASLSDKPVEVPKYDDIQLWIDMNHMDSLVQALDRYMLAAIDSMATIADVKRVALNVLLRLNERLQDKKLDIRPEWEVNVLAALLNRKVGILDIRDWLFSIIHSLAGVCKRAKNDSGSQLEQAIRFIDKNYKQDISLQEVALSLYMSPSYFSVKFKEAAGMNFIDYVTMKRVEQAAALLAGTNKKVVEISREVGYEDEKYFSRVFKREKQVSPGQYRKEKQVSEL